MTKPISYASITAAHWQPTLGTSGEVVEGLRDIDYAIRIIILPPTGTQLNVDSQVEESQIPCLLRELESDPDGPDISDSERGFLPASFPLFQG
jgi:hypothetical protein